MAKGGMGDVLTGLLAGFIAQGLTPFDAARAAVFLHGDVADIAAEKTSERALLASVVLNSLGTAMKV